MNAFDNFNRQGYPTGAAATGAPMGYGQPTTHTPMMSNPLTDEDRKLLAEKVDQFDLNVTREELAYAICTHKKNGQYDVVKANDGSDDLICKTCHVRFNPNVVTPAYVERVTSECLNLLQTLKYIGIDMNNEVIKQYFAMIPYIQRIPKLYKLLNSTFQKYQEASPVMETSTPNIFNAFNMMTNPAVPMGGYGYNGMNGYGQPMPQAPMGYGQPTSAFTAQQQQMMGGSPFYNTAPQAPVQPAPQQGAPGTDMQAMINQAVADAMKQQNGGAAKPAADVTVKEKMQL